MTDSTDIGLPLGPSGKAALLPGNIARFGEGLGVPEEEVRLYLALREAAHQRLFAHVPWLRSHLFGAVEGYARGIKVDTTKLEDMVGQIDPQHPEELQNAFARAGIAPREHVIAYCNGGVAATTVLFGLALAGHPHLTNYDGSWNEWGVREEWPVELPF